MRQCIPVGFHTHCIVSTVLYPPSERSETGRYYVFTFVCLVRTQSHWFEWAEWHIVFDSCVKSWEYFRADNMSLKTTFYWLSDDLVRFRIEVGLRRNVQKCNTISDGICQVSGTVSRCQIRTGSRAVQLLQPLYGSLDLVLDYLGESVSER